MIVFEICFLYAPDLNIFITCDDLDVYFKVGGYNIGHNGGHGSEGIILPDELGRWAINLLLV